MLLKLVTPASFFQELSALAAKLGRWAVHVIPRNFKSKQSGSSKILPLSLTSPLHRLCPLAFATATSSLPIPQQRQRGHPTRTRTTWPHREHCRIRCATATSFASSSSLAIRATHASFLCGGSERDRSISIWGSRRDLDSFLDSFHLIIAAAPFHHHSLFVEPSVNRVNSAYLKSTTTNFPTTVEEPARHDS
jgi:hypothetical protein